MARQSATFLRALCKLLTYLLLIYMILPLMHCRQLVPKISKPKHKSAISRPEQKPVVGLRIDLVHRDSPLSPFFPGNITSTERVKQAVQRSQERLEALYGSIVLKAGQLAHAGIQGQVSAGSGEYTMKLEIGEPSLSYSAILDTSSDLIWTQCLPCDDCSNQSYAIYDPSQSSTYMTVTCESPQCQPTLFSYCSADACNYFYQYADYSSSGILSYETFTFSTQSINQIVFGCGQYNEGHFDGHGGVGFGRGSLSLISQLASLGLGNKFSYCLQGFDEPSYMVSPLFIGHSATLNAEDVSSTPFIQNEYVTSSFYYVSLEGISLGGELLDIPAATFDIQDDGSGGFMIDSRVAFTLLYDDAYQVLKKALISSIHFPQTDGSGLGLDLCFNLLPDYKFRLSSDQFPTMTFHFKGADYVLQPEHYFYVDDTIFCLAMLPNSETSISALGNFQQQNYQILYDNDKNMLSFAPTDSDSL